jgi:steroid 5-alpha reductase family enzyme
LSVIGCWEEFHVSFPDLAGAGLLQLVALSVAMAGAWIVHERTGNSGWIDAVWTFAVGTIAIVSALVPLSEASQFERQLLVAALVAVWMIRLGHHIVMRSAAKADDPRYAELKREWGGAATRKMFTLVQNQALVSLPLPFAVLVAAHNPEPGLGWRDALALLVFVAAVVGETVSDRQLRTCIEAAGGNAGVCDAGLWRYSRHPNYFFEWLHWLAYPIIAIDLSGNYPWGWAAVGAPLVMYWLLRHVSGVPPLESHMLRKHGSAYRAYQTKTSAFFPWVPGHE